VPCRFVLLRVPSWQTRTPRRDATVAYQEKNKAAASSVVAAIGLTTLKIVVGLLTGSLGILAEAAHSALDLAAALMTWFAVRISGKPPDSNHPTATARSRTSPLCSRRCFCLRPASGLFTAPWRA